MKLKIKKSLVRGEYHINFQTVGFNEEETERINKFGPPKIDFSSDGLGEHDIERLDVSFKADTQEEAEEMMEKVQNQMKEKMSDLLSRLDTFSGEDVVEI
jgi:hypothetical protein